LELWFDRIVGGGVLNYYVQGVAFYNKLSWFVSELPEKDTSNNENVRIVHI
jgi:hypothetical protein